MLRTFSILMVSLEADSATTHQHGEAAALDEVEQVNRDRVR